MSKYVATTDPDISVREQRNAVRSGKIAAGGMVLLKNNGALPITQLNGSIALFGNGARRTVKGGTGSGEVNSRFAVTIEQGLEAAGFEITTKAWLNRYDEIIEAAHDTYIQEIRMVMDQEGQAAIMRLFNNPFIEPLVPSITDEDIAKAKADIAIYVLARNSGEGKDRTLSAGDYLLSESEENSLRNLAKSYKHFVVVLNVGGVIDTKILRGIDGIGAILLMSQAGCHGGHALAEVLTGKVNPSGRLTTTWAENYTDYPSANTFSHMNGNLDDEYYTEGIYVGYRYFDSFNITPAYPFGYGLSYTDFEIKTKSVIVKDGSIYLSVQVVNIGQTYAGREVVQVYVSAPDGKLEKPYQSLAAFAKTKLLEPKETQTLELNFPLAQVASYDEETASYILEKGSYFLRVGTNSRRTTVAAELCLTQSVVIEKLSNCLLLDCELSELSAKAVTAYSYPSEAAEKLACIKIRIDTVPALAQTNSVKEDDRISALVSRLTVREMAELCVGTARMGMGASSFIGMAANSCPGAAGETTSSLLDSHGIQKICFADGPAGLRLLRYFAVGTDDTALDGFSGAPLPGMDKLLGGSNPNLPEGAIMHYQYCTALPIDTLLAQTWDREAIQVAGDIVGEEMVEMGVNLWLAPGMNIQKNPLCGRNFEYFSEDPLLSGSCAAAETLGVQKHHGAGTTIKHFALNNQEDNRMHTNAHVSERAAREIYLKGFEIAVKEAQPLSIMSSYNLINGVHAANSRDLLTAIARDEWGFEGIVVTDWGTTGTMGLETAKDLKYGSSDAAACIHAGNDVIMPGSQKDVDAIVSAVESGKEVTLTDLQTCVKRILKIIERCS